MRAGADHAEVANATASGRSPPPPLATPAGHADTATMTSRSARKTIESPGRERGDEIDRRPSAATDVHMKTLNATVTVAAGTPKPDKRGSQVLVAVRMRRCDPVLDLEHLLAARRVQEVVSTNVIVNDGRQSLGFSTRTASPRQSATQFRCSRTTCRCSGRRSRRQHRRRRRHRTDRRRRQSPAPTRPPAHAMHCPWPPQSHAPPIATGSRSSAQIALQGVSPSTTFPPMHSLGHRFPRHVTDFGDQGACGPGRCRGTGGGFVPLM